MFRVRRYGLFFLNSASWHEMGVHINSVLVSKSWFCTLTVNFFVKGWLCELTIYCRRLWMKFNSRIEGLSEGCFEGMEVDLTVRRNSVEGQSPSQPIQIHSHPTGSPSKWRHKHFLTIVLNTITIIGAHQTPRLISASHLEIVHLHFLFSSSVCDSNAYGSKHLNLPVAAPI